MPPHDIKDGQTLVRRVSFSDRLHYSDDASSTTVTTDDDLYEDDGSLKSGSDGESALYESQVCTTQDSIDEDTEQETIANVMNGAAAIEEHTEEIKDATSDDADVVNMQADEETTTVASGISTTSPNSLYEDPPLVIRDVGVYERPSEYLGGYEPEGCASSGHRVKLRKSWFRDAKDANEPPHDQFEAWKKSRVVREPLFKKKQHKEEDIVTKNERVMIPEIKDDVGSTERSLSSKGCSSEISEGGKILKFKTIENETHGENIPVLKPTPSKMVHKVQKTEDTATKCKTDAISCDSAANEDFKLVQTPKAAFSTKAKVATSTTLSDVQSYTLSCATKQPNLKDPETSTFEMEIQELRYRIAKLQRSLDVTEVRTISQLADLEEETTKRMQEYRSKANDIARKSRATEERKLLKEKAMKSQDLIDLLRRSNQTLRVEGIKMKKAIEDLKKTNERLQEKNSVHMDYVAQFRDHQNMEVLLAQEMNQVLNKSAPKYEKLIRGMEECIKSRAKSVQCERKAKELYVECVQSIFAIVEENSTDNSLLERVQNIVLTKSDDDTKMDRTKSNYKVKKRASTIRNDQNDSKCDKTTATSRTGNKRLSGKSRSLDDEDPIFTKVTSRGCSNSDGIKPIADTENCGSVWKKTQLQPHLQACSTPRRSSSSSFRSIRSPKKPVCKLASDDDDASTCSNTSAQSETYSLSSSVAGYFK